MKIIKTSVCDPRLDGHIEPPYLQIQVDEEPKPLGSRRTVSSRGPQLNMIQYGPFLYVDPIGDWKSSEEELAGYVNTAALPPRFDKVVPVEVSFPDGLTSFFMSVNRARSNLKKSKQPYDFILSDVAARHGRIQWDLERKPKVCMFFEKEEGAVCELAPVRDTINVYGTQMPACTIHISSVRAMARDLRLQKEGVRR